MATKQTANGGTKSKENETKVTTVTEMDGDFSYKRDRSQIMRFAKMQEILQRNPARSLNKSFTQYTKDLIKTYI